jgi:hypothetical protein
VIKNVGNVGNVGNAGNVGNVGNVENVGIKMNSRKKEKTFLLFHLNGSS